MKTTLSWLSLREELPAQYRDVQVARVDSVNEIVRTFLRSYFAEQTLDETLFEELSLGEVVSEAVAGATERLIGEAVSDSRHRDVRPLASSPLTK